MFYENKNTKTFLLFNCSLNFFAYMLFMDYSIGWHLLYFFFLLVLRYFIYLCTTKYLSFIKPVSF